MNHTSGSVAPTDAEVVQVGDAIWQRAEPAHRLVMHAVLGAADDGQHVVIDGAGAAVTPSLGLGGAQPVEGALAGSEPWAGRGQRVARDPAPGSAKTLR